MSSSHLLYLTLFTTGLTVGFGHCIGMCGPIVVSLSLNIKKERVFISHILYNAGRVTMYAFLGGLMGLTGSFTIVKSNIVVIQKGVMTIAGLMIIIMGIAMSGLVPFGRIFGDYYNPKGLISRGYNILSSSKSFLTTYPLGLLLGLLPCGSLYAALITSARTGMEAKSASEGFLVGMCLMLAFGLGTVPSLILVGKMADLRWLKSRAIVYKIAAVLMLIVGIKFLIKGLQH